MTPWRGAITPATRALRVYSPHTNRAANATATPMAARVSKVNDSGRMSKMRPSHALARASSLSLLKSGIGSLYEHWHAAIARHPHVNRERDCHEDKTGTVKQPCAWIGRVDAMGDDVLAEQRPPQHEVVERM